jgi:hypothetical protein
LQSRSVLSSTCFSSAKHRARCERGFLALVAVSFQRRSLNQDSLSALADFRGLSPPYGIGSAPPGASAGWLLESGTRFSLCSAPDGRRRRRAAMASRAWSSARKKRARPPLMRALELPPLFRALSWEGQRSDRDKYDLDSEFGPGSLCKRPRIACPRRSWHG